MPEEQYVVELDREICMGSGVCVSYAAGTFAMGSDAAAEVTTPIVTDVSDVEVAASGCPTGAITVTRRTVGSGKQ
ncbi:ferredoxin [Rhodococcus artemisiae]|uniref:Ferredoxin n=1 Tax=Rhodococcus artemisiae TaxID=714159 RepID=A0ABU7LCQ9_9NOCA|nr:ferredoxin [Rhodococcus artemisiae]MEE2059342.1 ferredoxin [Rhodococcus artemisiae]